MINVNNKLDKHTSSRCAEKTIIAISLHLVSFDLSYMLVIRGGLIIVWCGGFTNTGVETDKDS